MHKHELAVPYLQKIDQELKKDRACCGLLQKEFKKETTTDCDMHYPNMDLTTGILRHLYVSLSVVQFQLSKRN